jgi:hypothetical protein
MVTRSQSRRRLSRPCVRARVDHIANSMVNANHSIERMAVKFPVIRCIGDAVIIREGWYAPVSGADGFKFALDGET